MEQISTTYAQARTRFVEAAEVAGAALSRFDHPLAGREGEALSVDAASFGPVDAESVLVVVSGTHGVEGYAGSALQIELLRKLTGDRPNGVRLHIVHAFNPYGFSWVRRVNEDNVDLNRNFIDWSGETPPNDEYAELGKLLVPTDWSQQTQDATLMDLMGKVETMGLPKLQDVISRGQYHDKTGLFYGGTGETWSHRWLKQWSADELGHAKRIAILDLHTGLGGWGTAQLIGTAPEDSDEHRRAASWWGEVVAMGSQGSVSATLTGDWVGTVPRLFPATETTAIAIEYGTVDPITVLQALRADAQLHAYGDPTAPEAASIRAQVRSAFCDDDPKWISELWGPLEAAVTAAYEQLG